MPVFGQPVLTAARALALIERLVRDPAVEEL
jgi:hypothetical protein